MCVSGLSLTNFNKLLAKSSEINDLCTPIKNLLGINYFNYIRLNKDNSRLSLTNYPKYIEDFYIKKSYAKKYINTVEKSCIKEIDIYQDYFQWKEVADVSASFAEAEQHYNITNGITLIKRFPNFVELYYFGIPKNTIKNSDVLKSNIDLLDRFILYFKDKGNKTITYAEENPITVKNITNCIPLHDMSLNACASILSHMNQFRFIYQQGEKKIFLTARETMLLIYLIMQFSMREIAEKLRCSHQTIENCLNGIKSQLSCYTRHSLIEKLNNLKIIDISIKNKEEINFFQCNFITSTSKEYLLNTAIENIHLDGIRKNIYLTKQEAICAFYLCHGYSAKNIANNTNRTFKTIEAHIYNLKKKLSITTKSSLTSFFIHHKILPMIALAYPELSDVFQPK
ncbi:MAG: hypothetical protein A2X78_04510 [Gammaproteobacteria bacterium GWE2_37_16]|nr:MAG: hypothetical protein A2X78_04510 [Gammaproteobacteria bacterium GWE2_37_16]